MPKHQKGSTNFEVCWVVHLKSFDILALYKFDYYWACAVASALGVCLTAGTHPACKATFPLLIRSTQPSQTPKFPDQARPTKLYTTCSRSSMLVYGRVTIAKVIECSRVATE